MITPAVVLYHVYINKECCEKRVRVVVLVIDDPGFEADVNAFRRNLSFGSVINMLLWIYQSD